MYDTFYYELVYWTLKFVVNKMSFAFRHVGYASIIVFAFLTVSIKSLKHIQLGVLRSSGSTGKPPYYFPVAEVNHLISVNVIITSDGVKFT